METLERLSSSIAQVELLFASLKRENRDLSQRLAQAAASAKAGQDLHEAELTLLKRQLHDASQALRHDPGLEARAHQAELEAADLAGQLEEARRQHLDEKVRLEEEVQRLRRESLAPRPDDQALAASEAARREAQGLRETAEAEVVILRQRLTVLEMEAHGARAAAEAERESAVEARQELEALQARLAEREKRITALESASHELERQWGEAQLRLAESAKPEEVAAWQLKIRQLEGLAGQAEALKTETERLDAERLELKRQKRDLAVFAKERQALRRKVEELMATLQSVRVG